MIDLARSKRLRDAFRNRDQVFSTWTSIPSAQIAEAFTFVNADCVSIDIEHGTASFEDCQRIIAAAQSNGQCCLPRISYHSMEMIKRLCDSGADGVIVPMVETCEQVENLIQWLKYPPVGNRSFGINRAQSYGLGFDEYVSAWNQSSSLILQIESIQGVQNIDALLSYEEVDGVMVGLMIFPEA